MSAVAERRSQRRLYPADFYEYNIHAAGCPYGSRLARSSKIE
jgi:hypothetical protein